MSEKKIDEIDMVESPAVQTYQDYLEKDVRLRIGVVGVGNAGNQVLGKLFKKDYPVFAVNTSCKDLSNTVVADSIPSFIAGDQARGAGKSRALAKTMFQLNGQELFSTPAFTDVVEKSDIIVVVASTGGGTGSGIAPDICRLCQMIYDNKIVIFFGILPKISDSITAQANTIECLNEIHKLQIPYMLADLFAYEDIPNDIAYEKIGTHVVESISAIHGDYLNYSANGMIDENDMRVICSEPGYMAVYMLNSVTQRMVDEKSIQSQMVSLIKHSPATMVQRDKIVKELGIIVNCPEEMMEASKTGNYNELTEFVGVPLSIFENYSVNSDLTGQFIAIMSGMSLPVTRLDYCKKKIREHEEALKRVKPIDLEADAQSVAFLTGHSTTKLTSDSREGISDSKKKAALGDFFGNAGKK